MWCEQCQSGPDPSTGRCRCRGPERGDRVRLVPKQQAPIEGILQSLSHQEIEIRDGCLHHSLDPSAYDIVILERVEDPIGTVRGDRYVKLRQVTEYFNWWDLKLGDWVATADGQPFTGTIPGSVAAAAARATAFGGGSTHG